MAEESLTAESKNWQDLITLDHSARAKRLALRVDSRNKTVRLVIPKRTSIHKALDFASQHSEWIVEKAEAFADTIDMHEGSTIVILGHDRIIEREPLDQTLPSYGLEDGRFIIRTNRQLSENMVLRQIKKLAHDTIAPLACQKADAIRKDIKTITMRDTKSRWGSCTQDGSLSFSWRLIFAPYEVLDYVVAHEVAHLAHMDHSKNFWDVCDRLSVSMDSSKDWLKIHGSNLQGLI